MAASTITRAALTNGSTPWNVSTISSAVYDKIDQMFGGVGGYATLELGGALKINGALTQLSNDGGALGTSSLGWSDLFLASGGVINWNNGDVTITHSTNTLTFAGAASGYVFNDGSLAWGGGAAITSSTDVVVLAGAQTISGGKTFSSVTGTNFTVTADTPHIIDIRNLSAGSSASSRIRVGNDATTEGVVLAAFGSTHGTFPNRSRVVTSLVNGMDFGAEDASGIIRFLAGGSQKMQLNTAGELMVGYTTDQGAYLLQVNSQIFATNATIATSDGRFKTDVQPVREGLAAVKALKPVQFTWKKHPVHNFIDGTDVGFIAQDVRAALAGRAYTGAVVTTNGTGANEFLGMADAKLIPLLVAAVQELSAEVNALKAH